MNEKEETEQKIRKEPKDEKEMARKIHISENISENLQFNKINDKYGNEFKNNKNSKIEIENFSNNILKIKKNNYYYLLDKYKYDINTIMMLLDLKKLYVIKEIFRNYPDGIEKIIFIKELKKKLPVDVIDSPNLIYGLYKFFCEIDYNGDQCMQWEEFTQFIIDTVEGDSQAKNVDEEVKKAMYNEKKMRKFKNYQICQKVKDSHLYKNEITSIIFIPRFNLIAVNEYGTRLLKLYNPINGQYIKCLDIEEYINPIQFKAQHELKSKKKLNNLNDFPERKKNKNNLYRVLCVTRYQSLIALCLSDKRIIFLNFELDEHVEFLYEITLPILERRLWYLKNHNIWVSSGSKMPKCDFFTLNELDIEFNYNGQKYECLYNEGHPYRNHYIKTSSPHLSEIMDCIEITNPLLVLTACLDGKIRLINIETKKLIKIWNYHNFGVKQLDYNPNLDGGYVSSVGYEYFINLYNLEYSLEDVYKGKLEGSFSPIISCQFILESYMAVSVDEEGNIRIWNIKNKVCVQYIPQIIKKCKINNLLIMPKYNKFIIYGNRIIYYESQYNQKNKKEEKEDNYPLKVLYNFYYQQFYIATLKDIRVYNSQGKFIKIFQKLIPNNFDIDTKITNFIFENNYRKIYVGFSNGAILQFNAGNGALIKSVNEDNNLKEKTQNINEFFHKKEITGLYFYSRPNDENLLISTSCDSLINISYEQNSEKSELLKTIKGGHSKGLKNYEILCMDFSEVLNIFATGGSDGYVVIWDLEMSKVIYLFTAYNISYKIIVTSIKFLDPFPVIASAFSDGTLYLYEINKSKKFSGKCILRARNYCLIYSTKTDICNIKSMNISYGQFPEFKDNIIALKKYFMKNESDDNNNKDNITKDNININKKDNNEQKANNKEEKIVEIIDKDLDLYLNNEMQLKYYLFIGNEKGYLKIVNLYPLFKKYNINSLEKEEIKSTLNLYKKEEINVSATIKYLLRKNKDNNIIPFINMYYNLIIFERIDIHKDEIINIEILKDPLCFITCSKDYYLKIHNFKGENIGSINVLPFLTKEIDKKDNNDKDKKDNDKIETDKNDKDKDKKDWKFEINEKEIMEKEIKQIVDIFEKIGVEPIIIGSELDEEMKKRQKEEKKEKHIEKINIRKIYEKKRFKPIVKVKEDKNKNEKEEDSYKENEYIAAERYFVQNAKNQIEKEMYGSNDNNGIVEITNQLIEMTVKKEKKKKEKIDNKEIVEMNLFMPNKDKIKKLKKYSLNDIRKIENIKLRENNDSKIEKENKTIFNRSKFNKFNTNNTELIELNNNKINNEMLIDKNNIQNDPLTPRNKINPKFSLFSPIIKDEKPDELFDKMIKKYKKIDYKKIKKLEINKDNRHNNKAHIIRFYNFRNELLTTRLFKKNKPKIEFEQNDNSRCLSYEKTMSKFNNKILPNLFNKIIFKKGETEKFINYQFYNSAYKACCDTSKNGSFNNISIKTTYKNNWKFVTKYLKNKRDNKKK